MISPEEFTQQMARLEIRSGNCWDVKQEADEAVAEMLKQLGYGGGASIFERIVEPE